MQSRSTESSWKVTCPASRLATAVMATPSDRWRGRTCWTCARGGDYRSVAVRGPLGPLVRVSYPSGAQTAATSVLPAASGRSEVRSLNLDEVELGQASGQGNLGLHAELGVHVCQVLLHGAVAHEQLGSDLPR